MEKIKFLLIVVLFGTISFGSTLIAKDFSSTKEKLLKANVEALADDMPCLCDDDCPAGWTCIDGFCFPGSPKPFCYAGGPGAVSCSIEGGVEIAGVGISAGCSVGCDGVTRYACCTLRCICVPY
jgi:hypothetical protein